MAHGEEVGGELVLSGGDTTEVLQLGEEALNQVTLVVEMLAEAGFPTPVALRRDVGRSALFLDQRPDAVSVIGFIGKDDGVGAELIEKLVGDLAVVRLPSGQAEPDWKTLRVDDRVDFGVRSPRELPTQ